MLGAKTRIVRPPAEFASYCIRLPFPSIMQFVYVFTRTEPAASCAICVIVQTALSLWHGGVQPHENYSRYLVCRYRSRGHAPPLNLTLSVKLNLCIQDTENGKKEKKKSLGLGLMLSRYLWRVGLARGDQGVGDTVTSY